MGGEKEWQLQFTFSIPLLTHTTPSFKFTTMTDSPSNTTTSPISATTPERCLSPLLPERTAPDVKTQATSNTASPKSTSSSPKSRRVRFALPEETFAINDERLLRAFDPVPWEPSVHECRLTNVGTRNAHMLIRTLETSAAIWTSALIAEYCNKNDVQDPETPFKAFTPPQDEAANSRILQYQQAVADCEKEARGVKRALRGYAPVYDRHHEFRGSDEDTATWVDGRYILYGEYSATRPKRQRRAYQPSECSSPDKENRSPSPRAETNQSDNDNTCHVSVQEPEEPLPRGGVVPSAERCTLCDEIPGPKTPHREENCRWTT